MTFSYDPTGSGFTDLENVRAYTGDTVEAESFLSDEEINSLIADEGTWQKATIAALRMIILKLSKPNFRADWLQVDNKTAREGYQQMLVELQKQLGISRITATARHTYRADSRQTEAPDYSSGTVDDDDDEFYVVVVHNP